MKPTIDAYLEAEYQADLAYLDQFSAQQALEHAAMVEAGERVVLDAGDAPRAILGDSGAPQTIDPATLWPKEEV